MDEPNSLLNHDKKELTYKEYLRSRFTNTVVLSREMERTLGKEQAHEIIKNAFYKDMEDMVKEELLELGPVESFKDFVKMEKEENESPEFRNIVSLTYPHETSTELSLHVKECFYAEVFKELEAEELCRSNHSFIIGLYFDFKE